MLVEALALGVYMLLVLVDSDGPVAASTTVYQLTPQDRHGESARGAHVVLKRVVAAWTVSAGGKGCSTALHASNVATPELYWPVKCTQTYCALNVGVCSVCRWPGSRGKE